jgi:hypothetical protein
LKLFWLMVADWQILEGSIYRVLHLFLFFPFPGVSNRKNFQDFFLW